MEGQSVATSCSRGGWSAFQGTTRNRCEEEAARQRRGKKKKNMSGVKSAREKRGARSRSGEGMGRADGFSSFRVCQSSRILAAGFWNALSDKSSFVTNARRSPSFPSLTVYGLLAHSRKLFFLLKEDQDPERPWTRGSRWHRTARAEPSPPASGELRLGQGCKVCHLNTR